MVAGIQLPKALQLISGVPLMKVATAFFEKLSIPKRLDGGAGLGGLMAQVLKDGNLSSIMQNPMATTIQGIQGQLSGLVGQLTNIQGTAGLIQSLTGASGLGNALGVMQAAGDNLAGLTNGGQGFFDMMGHAATVDMAGAALPLAATMDAVTAPLNSAPMLGTLATNLPRVISLVTSGQMAPDAAATWVQTQTYTIGSITSGSAAALAYGAQVHPLLATVATVAGAVAVPPTFDAEGYRQEGEATGFQAVLGSIVQPAPAAQMHASVEAQIRHVKHDPIDVAGMTKLDD